MHTHMQHTLHHPAPPPGTVLLLDLIAYPCTQLYLHLNTGQQTKLHTHLDAVEDDGSAAHGLESAHGRRHATGHDFLWKQERMVKTGYAP